MLEVFKRLAIHGQPAKLTNLVKELTLRPAVGWARAPDREPPGKPNLADGYDIAAFRREGGPIAPVAVLFLMGRGHLLEVTNIVPETVPSLSRAQYNAILDDFADNMLGPRLHGSEFSVTKTDDHLPITHWLSEPAARKLKQFSALANRSVLHPLDSQRWRAFLIQAHLDHTELDTETLQRWLVEEEHWPEDSVVDLAIQFENGLQLLVDYDKALG